MSRSNKSRKSRWWRGGYGYITSHQTLPQFLKAHYNGVLRHAVRQMLGDILFTDAYDEKEIPGKRKEHRFDVWFYD